ncbi:hypothetical protein M408DRAFT_29493 [Serendipita vermifera MAFF 305830]|uniref:Uncharacterized protein n=1 Tax=Serendipita vermifera MAFF 305830 TaxID=933852 RepID=A0A0C3AND3_SERVB|nr:hypothetical protein M408DRAFT_29493 [Serendipita vermifera MAFF 305830]
MDKTIQVWDAEIGAIVVGPLKGHSDPVNSIAFSPDGKRIFSGSLDATIRIWDAETGAAVAGPLGGYGYPVRSVAFSPDGKRIASGSSDKTVRVWDAETGSIMGGPLEGHSDPVNSVAFSPDGKRIVSGSEDLTNQNMGCRNGRSYGKRIVSGSSDQAILVWDAETGAIVGGPLEGHNNRVTSVVFSPNGTRIVSGSEDVTVRVWKNVSHETQVFNSLSPTFNDSSKMVNGWVLGPKSELLFWVPPMLRLGLYRPANMLIIAQDIVTKLNLDDFVSGNLWVLCKTRSDLPGLKTISEAHSSVPIPSLNPIGDSASKHFVRSNPEQSPRSAMHKAGGQLTNTSIIRSSAGKKAKIKDDAVDYH